MPDPTNECSEEADWLEKKAGSGGPVVVMSDGRVVKPLPTMRHDDSAKLEYIAALLRKVGTLVERAKRIERGCTCRYDDRCGNCQAVVDLHEALAAFSPEPNRERDAAAERTRVAES